MSQNTALLDDVGIAALRQFFALLDEWDKKKNLTEQKYS
jgi:16S rRNA G527 N7-methylase RsmG